jgi:autotransporter-associated beta strand protein
MPRSGLNPSCPFTRWKLLLLALLTLAGNPPARAADTELNAGFNGPTGADTFWWPNDPNAAVGPNHVMVIINGIYRIYNKSGTLVGSGNIDSLFNSINPSVATLDPNIMYDDVAGRFVLEANGSGNDITNAYLAVSDTSDPTQGFTEVHAVSFPGAYDGSKAGFNADIYVICATTGTAVIDKSTMLDANNATFTVTSRTTSTYGRAARMHGSASGGPMYFTSASGGAIRVTRLDNVLSATPIYTGYNVSGSSGCTDPATPAWRSNSLVTANTGAMYWWQVDTSGATPTLTQQGFIGAPSGYTSGYGSANLAPNGDIGMTYMQYSANTTPLPVSMWVAWRAAADASGTVRMPIQAVTSDPLTQANARHGDFSSTVCDIDTNGNTLNTFWACNGYIRPNLGEATWVQNFGGPLTPPAITAPPQNLTVDENAPATLSVKAAGAQPFRYQWRRSGVDVAGATDNPFVIPITTTNDSGDYTVVITNTVGSVTSVVATLAIVPGVSGVWINAAGGSWTNSANWSGGVVATGIGRTADFRTLNLGANAIVTLDGPRVIGNLLFADITPSHNWALNPGANGSLTLDVTNGTPTVTVSNQTATLGVAVAGVDGLTKDGAGTLALSVQNPFTGGATVTGGILDLTGGGGGSGTIRGTATINAGGTLRLSTGDATGYNGDSTCLTTINLVGGTLAINTTANQTLGNCVLNLTGGAITGTSASDNLDFFKGASALNTLASATVSTISGTALSPLRQGSTTFTVAAGTTASGIDLDISSMLRTSPSGDAAGAVLIKAGPGVMRLSAVNTYVRGTAISAGTLALGAGGSIASSTPLTIVAGALFDVSAPGSFTLGSGKTLNAGRAINPATDLNGSLISSGIINVGGAGAPGIFTIKGNLTLTGGTLNCDLSPAASDLITLAGPGRALTLTGTTTIIPGSGFYPNGTYTLINGFASVSGTAANLAWGGTAGSSIRGTPVAAFAIMSSNATVTISGGTPAALTWKGTLSGAWDINTIANWQNALLAPDTFFNLDTVTFSDSPITTAVTIASNVYPGAVIFNNTTTSSYTLSGAGSIAGGASVTKTTGNGTVYLNTTNAYTGGTTLGAGTISLGNGANENASGLGAGPVSLNSGGTLMFAPGSTANNYSIKNAVTLNGGTVWVEDGKQHLTGSVVNVAAGGGTLNTKWGAKDLWIDSQLTGSGPLTLAHTPGGDGGTTGVHFSNPLNTYNGAIIVNSATTPVQVANAYALAKATLNLAANNGLIWDGVTNIVLGGLSGAGNIANGGNALAVGNNNLSTTYSGVLSGAGSLTKLGTGVFTLSGASTYSGATAVSNGTLIVNGSLGANTVTVQNTAMLGGLGVIAGAVVVMGGATLSPGATIGTLTTGSETWNAGGNYRFELNNPTNNAGWDRANITGTLNVQATSGARFTIKLASLTAGNTPGILAGFDKSATYAWTIATASGGVLNFSTDKFTVDTSSFSNDFSGIFSVVLQGGNILVAYQPVTAPSFTGFAEIGAGAFQFQLTNSTTTNYTVLSSTNLVDWSASGVLLQYSNGVFQFVDPVATNASAHFYRLRWP